MIKSFNDEILNKTDEIDNSIVKEELRNLIREKLGNYGTNLNRRAIEKEYEKLTFGEPMLEGILCNSTFVQNCNCLTHYFFSEE